jgi:hypothetical protein
MAITLRGIIFPLQKLFLAPAMSGISVCLQCSCMSLHPSSCDVTIHPSRRDLNGEAKDYMCHSHPAWSENLLGT